MRFKKERREAHTDEGELYFFLAAARADRAGCFTKMREYITCCATLAPFFNEANTIKDLGAFSAAIQEKAVQHAESLLAGFRNDSDDSSKERHARLRRRLIAWAARSRACGGIVVLDSMRVPAIDPAHARQLLADHWGQVFAKKITDEHAQCELLKDLSAAEAPVHVEPIGYDAFLASLQHVPESAPGPDGIPFSVWHSMPEIAHKTLYEIYEFLCSGGLPPDGFNHSL